MKRPNGNLRKMIEENKREILANQKALSNIEKKIDNKIVTNSK
ncbi:FbpB family small basic protein [Heyndrickxia acidicola]|uniref:FbpB family small basic protein n=1 Tax=Heyndrickxia acidicola TaxID=209389 RepID=A0ABU6MKC7_9BACI|nr:FbpB family small basic protein [Heyndrickxia acidicola]MED1203505.1 FbpB family small basic protein [Heyndrickxia acidicola]